MKRLGLLTIALALACNATSDGETDTDGNSGGGSSASETDEVPTGTATATVSDSANTESASGATTDGTSSSTADASSGEGSSSSSSDSGSSSTEATSSSSSSSTGDLGPEDLCESTEGMWEPAACGDYVCGIPNDCEAIIPGCDCGQDANFVEGEGCVLDDACATFDCGADLECVTVAQYCMATFPGVKGAPITYECMPMPDACADSIDCVCLTTELMLPPPQICDEPVPDGLIVQVFLP